MSVELTARTEEGGHLVALAESLAEDFATRAADHDRNATYPFASIAALREAGYFGPFGIDAFRWLDVNGARRWNPRGEINARYSMGFSIGFEAIPAD